MNSYVTKKENLCLFETSGKKQGAKSLIRGRRANDDRDFAGEVLSSIISEFRGEIITGVKMTSFPVNY